MAPSSAPAPDFAFYRDGHAGRLDEGAFAAALPEAMARLRLLAGDEVPERCRDAYMHAACALADRAAGLDRSGEVASETVGSTSLTYARTAPSRAQGDYEAALPWLAGTGLLCRAVGLRG